MRPAPLLARVALIAAALAAGCATAPRGPRKCPESVSACATPMDCVMDARRDCLVCTCRAWDDATPRGEAAGARPEAPPAPPPPR